MTSTQSRSITRCGGIIFNKSNNSVLLVLNRISYLRGENKWGFPKGHRKQNEKLVDCARREIHEETGLILPSELFKKRIYIHNSLYFVIFLKQEINSFKFNDTNEIEKVEWISLDRLKQLNYNRDIKKFLQKNSSHDNFDFCEKNINTDNSECVKTIFNNSIISL